MDNQYWYFLDAVVYLNSCSKFLMCNTQLTKGQSIVKVDRGKIMKTLVLVWGMQVKQL